MLMKLKGLIAAGFTPMHPDGALRLEAVPGLVDFVISKGIDGFYLCGSTGEGPSLSSRERTQVAEAYQTAIAGRVPVIIHVGHNSLKEAKSLARHAAEIGCQAIAVAPPSYYPGLTLDGLVQSLQFVAEGAPQTPMYYYHIPRLTGVEVKPVELLAEAEGKLPTLCGVKFSDTQLDDFLLCTRHGRGDRFNMLFGADEMLLAGLAMGADGAVGSTYNFMAPLYRQILKSFEMGHWSQAQKWQAEATELVGNILTFGGIRAIKAAMTCLAVDCGPPRLPNLALSPRELEALQAMLTPWIERLQ